MADNDNEPTTAADQAVEEISGEAQTHTDPEQAEEGIAKVSVDEGDRESTKQDEAEPETTGEEAGTGGVGESDAAEPVVEGNVVEGEDTNQSTGDGEQQQVDQTQENTNINQAGDDGNADTTQKEDPAEEQQAPAECLPQEGTEVGETVPTDGELHTEDADEVVASVVDGNDDTVEQQMEADVTANEGEQDGDVAGDGDQNGQETQVEEGGVDGEGEQPPTEQDMEDQQMPAQVTTPAPVDTGRHVVTPTDGEQLDAVDEHTIESESVKPEEPGPNALNLTWSFGVNRNIAAINLTDGQRKAVLYTCAHIAVIYDHVENTQQLLQGHCNNISCTCVSEDKRWVATADKGPNSTVIMWDSHTGIPVQTLFDAHPDGGVSGMTMTPDAKYLATLSANGKKQTFAIWDWTTDSETPICTAELDESYGLQTYVQFNPEDITQIVSNSDQQVIFYSWKNDKIEYFAPSLTDQDFNRAVGNYSKSIFVSGTTKAYTATSCGNIVVWDNNRPISGPPSLEPSPNKKAFKLVRLQERGITVLTTTDNYVVTADVLGHVKFYDWHLRMSNWYSDFDVGPINSLSFEYLPEFSYEAKADSNYPPDATIYSKPFVTRDYMIGTSTAVIAHVVADGTSLKVIHREHDAAVHAVATHPSKPFVCIGSYAGYVKVWNYLKKEVVVQRRFPRGCLVRCLTYDPQGAYIAVGFTNGSVRILDALTLDDECPEPFRFSRDVVIQCAFSHDSEWLATADADYCVSVFKAQPYNEQEPWMYLGKQRAHYKPVRGIMFGRTLDSEVPRLLSVGEDRTLVEYAIFSSTTDNLQLISSDRIEQSAIPQCFTMYPPITKENFLLLANDQYKFKLYNSTTKMCRKTLLAPTYGSPLQRMEVLPTEGAVDSKRYLAYITNDKVGLHSMPLDGNPHNAMALIAHPGKVVNLACSYDGKHVFTAGGTDSSVHMWNVNLMVLEAGSKLGGEDLIPFYGLLEGGREGELFAELEDYFYYAQIRSQGVDTMDSREISTKIPLTEVPFVMRALGFYPSEQEIEDMLNEVKFSQYVETGKYVTDIDLGEFIKLYVNHRPAFGLSISQLQRAFEVLGLDDGTGVPAIDRGELLDLLQSKGEHMTEHDLAEFLTTLLGYNPEGGSSELGLYDPANAGDIIEDNLPESINSDMFASQVLGFGYDESAEQRARQESPTDVKSPAEVMMIH
ncbi:cilia- and flagella-associated protein 251-like [Saccoglossus kowalevskii]|uniref:Cilia- and flagella-associated protein 251 n=1 Tax=Saccoglossus kowalevskii TaxID=10224 RepID=A0ABM0MZ69_SACKO|nr:PREDICTED: WD repeat-containing protein 66-like [Saccoglossus kowalevskii]